MAANFFFFSHHFVSFPTDLAFYKAEINDVYKHLVIIGGICLKREIPNLKMMIGN